MKNMDGMLSFLCSVYIVIIVTTCTELYSLANLMNVHVSIHVKLLKQGDFFSWHLQLFLADLLISYNTEGVQIYFGPPLKQTMSVVDILKLNLRPK